MKLVILYLDSNNTYQYLTVTKVKDKLKFLHRHTNVMDEVPNIITTPELFKKFWNDRRSHLNLLDYFYHHVDINNQTIYLKPLVLNQEDNIYKNDRYTVIPLDNEVIVNYGNGKQRICKSLYEAIDWIANKHHPVQQVKALTNIIQGT